MKDVESNIKVYVTKDYSIFNFLECNRAVNQNQVKKIVKSIQEKGYYPVPILVDDNYTIIDGQHRFTALEQLNLPVYYIKSAFIDTDCVYLNVNAKNWNIIDYVRFYASKGIDSYQKLLNLWDPYLADRQSVFHSFSALRLAVIYDGGSIRTKLKTGEFVLSENITDISQRLSVINFCLKQFKTDVTAIRNIITALSKLLKNHLVVPNKLIDKFNQRKDKVLPGFRTVEQALYFINDIYNYKCLKKVDLVIAYKNLNLDKEDEQC